MFKNLCLSECALNFMARKWELDINSPKFATSLMEHFISFTRNTKTNEICYFSANFKPDISTKVETFCMASTRSAAIFSFEGQDPESNVWGKGVKCIIKISEYNEEAISLLRTMLKEIILDEKDSDV